MTRSGRRIDPAQRRAQLLDTARRLITERPFTDLTMDELSREAGTSRTLVYHYFPTKGHLIGALHRQVHDDLRQAVIDRYAGSSVRELVAAALDAHFDYYESNADLVLAVNIGPLSNNPHVRAPVLESLAQTRDWLLDEMELTGHRRALVGAGLAGWITLVREMCREWLQHKEISRDEVRDTCLRVFDAVVGG